MEDSWENTPWGHRGTQGPCAPNCAPALYEKTLGLRCAASRLWAARVPPPPDAAAAAAAAASSGPNSKSPRTERSSICWPPCDPKPKILPPPLVDDRSLANEGSDGVEGSKDVLSALSFPSTSPPPSLPLQEEAGTGVGVVGSSREGDAGLGGADIRWLLPTLFSRGWGLRALLLVLLLFRRSGVVAVELAEPVAAASAAAAAARDGGTMVPKIAEDLGLRWTLALPLPRPPLGRRGRLAPPFPSMPPVLAPSLLALTLLQLLLLLLLLLKVMFSVLARAAAAANPMSTPPEEGFFHQDPRPRPGCC